MSAQPNERERRDFAISCLWTERPLVRLFVARTGRTSFAVKELIAFALALPAIDFAIVVALTTPIT